MEKTIKKIEVGNIVALNSGGNKMTVTEINGCKVIVSFFEPSMDIFSSGDRLTTRTFDIKCLKIVTE